MMMRSLVLSQYQSDEETDRQTDIAERDKTFYHQILGSSQQDERTLSFLPTDLSCSGTTSQRSSGTKDT